MIYDSIGRVKTRTDAGEQTLSYEYNNLDHVTKIAFEDGTSIEYDYVCCGLVGVIKDRSGGKSYYDYDPMKRVTRMQDASGRSVNSGEKVGQFTGAKADHERCVCQQADAVVG